MRAEMGCRPVGEMPTKRERQRISRECVRPEAPAWDFGEPNEIDVADVIAGAAGCSRATAYELMERAIAARAA